VPVSRALRAKPLLWTATGAYAVGFSALSVLRHRSFETGRFDLGNMVQAVWSTAHGDPLAVTNLRGEQTVRLAAHVDPIIVAFAPLWWIWPSPDVLLVTQALAIAAGALPVFWLARKHLGSEWAALGFALAYLLYPATQWLTLNEFHPVALACPLLLYAFWYLDEDQLVAFCVFAAAAALTKEEVPLVVAGLGVWYAITRRRWFGAAVATIGVAAAGFAIGVVVPHFNEGAQSAFYGRYEEVGGSAGGIAKTAVTEPQTLVGVAFDERGLRYLVDLLLPLLGFPLAAPLALIPAVPELAINLLSATRTQTSIHFHYTAAEVAILFAAAVLGAKWIVRRTRIRPVTLATAVAGAALVSNYVLGTIPLWRHFPGGETLQARGHEVSEHDRIARRALRLIPAHEVVTASNSLGAHLSARRRVLSFPYVFDARWIAVDETKPGYADRVAPLAHARRVAQLRRNPSWRLVFSEDGVLVFRRRN
jgi:uncharacterized membrane protein